MADQFAAPRSQPHQYQLALLPLVPVEALLSRPVPPFPVAPVGSFDAGSQPSIPFPPADLHPSAPAPAAAPVADAPATPAFPGDSTDDLPLDSDFRNVRKRQASQHSTMLRGLLLPIYIIARSRKEGSVWHRA